METAPFTPTVTPGGTPGGPSPAISNCDLTEKKNFNSDFDVITQNSSFFPLFILYMYVSFTSYIPFLYIPANFYRS